MVRDGQSAADVHVPQRRAGGGETVGELAQSLEPLAIGLQRRELRPHVHVQADQRDMVQGASARGEVECLVVRNAELVGP